MAVAVVLERRAVPHPDVVPALVGRDTEGLAPVAELPVVVRRLGRRAVLVLPGVGQLVRRETLQLAITLWNCLVLRDCGQGEHLADLFDRLRGLSVTDTMRMAPLVKELVFLKHTKYRRDQRLVGDWELRDLGGGELSLRAVAHDPRRPRGT